MEGARGTGLNMASARQKLNSVANSAKLCF